MRCGLTLFFFGFGLEDLDLKNDEFVLERIRSTLPKCKSVHVSYAKCLKYISLFMLSFRAVIITESCFGRR